MRDTTNRPLTLAELLLKFGIACERADLATADHVRRELRERFGVTLHLPRRTRPPRRLVAAARDVGAHEVLS